MLLHLILVSFAAGSLVGSDRWEVPALTEMVEIMDDVVLLHAGWREVLKDPSFDRSDVLSSGPVSRLNVYHELFASTLKPDFPIDSVEHASTIIRVIHEAFGVAAQGFADLFALILSSPSSDAEILRGTRDTFSKHWASLLERLSDLQSRYEISPATPIPRTESGEVDVVTTKFVIDLAALGASRRHLVSETFVHLHQFHELLRSQQPCGEYSALMATLKLTMLHLQRSGQETLGEELHLVVQDATEFETNTRFLANNVSAVHQQVSVLVSSHPIVVDFVAGLKNTFAKKWKEVHVRSSVVVARASKELTRRSPPTPQVVESVDPAQMALDMMRYELVDVMERAVALDKDCAKFLVDSYAKMGCFGQNKFLGLTRYRRIFAELLRSKPLLLETQRGTIAEAQEAVGDFAEYIETLITELGQLGFALGSEREWIGKWRSLHEELSQLRAKHNVPDIRHSPPVSGLYASDPVIVYFLKQCLGSFNRTRELLAELYRDLVRFQEWISQHRKFFSQKIKAPSDRELEAKIAAAIQDAKQIEAFNIYEDLPALLSFLGYVESLDQRFGTHVAQLVEFMSSLQIRGDGNPVSDFFNGLRDRHHSQWIEFLKTDAVLRRDLEAAIAFRNGGGLVVRNEVPETPSVKPDVVVSSEDREKLFSELELFAAQEELPKEEIAKGGQTKTKKNMRRDKASIPPVEQSANRDSGATAPMLHESDEIQNSEAEISQEQSDDSVVEFQRVPNRKERRARLAAQARISQEALASLAREEPLPETPSVKPDVVVSSRENYLLEFPPLVPSPTPCANSDSTRCAGTAQVVNPSSTQASQNSRRRRKMVTFSSPENPMNNAESANAAPVAVNEPVASIDQTVVAAQRPEFVPSAASRAFYPRRNPDPRMDMCMHRLMELTALSYHAYAEMYHLCGSMLPELYSSGNIPGAQIVGSTQRLAQNAYHNTQIVHSFVNASWQTHFKTPK